MSMKYKADILELLKEKGFSTYKLCKENLLSQGGYSEHPGKKANIVVEYRVAVPSAAVSTRGHTGICGGLTLIKYCMKIKQFFCRHERQEE